MAWPRTRRVAAARAPGADQGGQEPVHVDGGRPGLPQAELAEDLDEADGPAPRAGGEQVGDLAGQAGVPAPHLAVADDRAAEALAEVEVGEVVQGGRAPPWSRSARAAQFTSLSTVTGPPT